MAYTWRKIHNATLDDAKMGRLSDHLWRRFFEFILLAGELDKGGLLPDIGDMAWRLHSAENEVTESLNALAVDSLTSNIDGEWHITNWEKHQGAADNKTRQQNYRDAKRRVTYGDNELRNESVTTRYTDLDLIKDKDKEEESDKTGDSRSLSSLVDLYQSELGRPITPLIADELKEAATLYPVEWFSLAFKEAVINNVPKWNYVKAILADWKTNGVKSKSNGNGRKPDKTEPTEERRHSYADDLKKAGLA